MAAEKGLAVFAAEYRAQAPTNCEIVINLTTAKRSVSIHPRAGRTSDKGTRAKRPWLGRPQTRHLRRDILPQI
jgi:hypothetical protein